MMIFTNSVQRKNDIPGVDVIKNSAGSVSDGLENVWIALGGTTISWPSSASTLPSGVENRIVPIPSNINKRQQDRHSFIQSKHE